MKFGKFTNPYGLELADDNSLVRSGLGFVFDSYTEGIEGGIYPDPGFINLAVFNGNTSGPNGPTQMGFSGKGGFSGNGWAIGGSVLGQDLDMPVRIFRYGGFGWGRLGPVVVLGEYDRGYNGVTSVSQNNVEAYHLSGEVDLGFDCFLRLATEWLGGDASTFNQAGYRHVVSFRCYPAHDLKFQVDMTRLVPDPATNPMNGAVQDMVLADAFFFY